MENWHLGKISPMMTMLRFWPSAVMTFDICEVALSMEIDGRMRRGVDVGGVVKFRKDNTPTTS
jgi:hypothetical protein